MLFASFILLAQSALTAASDQLTRVPLIHLPRENRYHGLIYVGSNYDKLQVFFDTMQTETALQVTSAEGHKIPSEYNVLSSKTKKFIY